MFGRRNLLKTGFAAAVGAALPSGRRAIAALPATTTRPPVEITDDDLADRIRATDWYAQKAEALARLRAVAEHCGAKIDDRDGPNHLSFTMPGLGVLYSESLGYPHLLMMGDRLDDGFLSIVIAMLAHPVSRAA